MIIIAFLNAAFDKLRPLTYYTHFRLLSLLKQV